MCAWATTEIMYLLFFCLFLLFLIDTFLLPICLSYFLKLNVTFNCILPFFKTLKETFLLKGFKLSLFFCLVVGAG